MLKALASLPRSAFNADGAKTLLTAVKAMPAAERAAAQDTLRAFARSREGEGTQWQSPDLPLRDFQETFAKGTQQPLSAAFSGPSAVLLPELIGEARPVQPQTMATVVEYLKRLCAEDEATGIRIAKDMVLFSRKDLSQKATTMVGDFLRFAEPQPHLSRHAAERLGLPSALIFSMPGKVEVARTQHRRNDSMTLYTAVKVSLPTRIISTLLSAASSGDRVTVAHNDRVSVVACYEPAMRRFAFELEAAPGAAPVKVRSPQHVSFDSLPTTTSLAFDME